MKKISIIITSLMLVLTMLAAGCTKSPVSQEKTTTTASTNRTSSKTTALTKQTTTTGAALTKQEPTTGAVLTKQDTATGAALTEQGPAADAAIAEQEPAADAVLAEQGSTTEVAGDSTKETIQRDLPDFEKKANEVIVTDKTVTFTDGLGETITINKNPKRVVGLYTSYTSLWYEAGGTIVGRIKTGDSDSQLPAAAIAEGIKIVGTSSSGSRISAETVLSVNPDLVILGTAMSQPNLVPSFKAANVQTIVVEYNDLYDYLKWFKVFANISGKPELYDSVAKAALQTALDVLKTAPVENNPTVFCMFGGTTELQANLSASMVGGMATAMGAVNIADSWNNPGKAERIDINIEALLKADPEFILIQCMSGEDEVKALVENTYGKNPVWNALSAVKNGKVYFLQRELFGYKPHGRFGEAYQIMGAILYPDLFRVH